MSAYQISEGRATRSIAVDIGLTIGATSRTLHRELGLRTTFTDPTLDYLYSIGISNENQAMVDARIAEEAAKASTEAAPTA
jgi:hypothetical protein